MRDVQPRGRRRLRVFALSLLPLTRWYPIIQVIPAVMLLSLQLGGPSPNRRAPQN